MSSWLAMLRGSGPCVDSPRLLGLMARPGLLRSLGLFILRLKFTPLLLERIRTLPAPLAERAELFTHAISLLNAGGSFKTTGAGRTRLADEAVLRHAARFTAPRVMEVGSSDGSASLELMGTLPSEARLLLTDRTPAFLLGGGWPAHLVCDAEGALLGLKLPGLYLHLPLGTRPDMGEARRIDTLNPLLQERDKSLGILHFDAFKCLLNEPVQIIKCANVLNRSYFTEGQIRAGAQNLGLSLAESGILVLSHNNARYTEGEALLVFEKRGARLELVEERNGHESLALFQEN